MIEIHNGMSQTYEAPVFLVKALQFLLLYKLQKQEFDTVANGN